eukprot:COSAG02_NODE_1326_length_13230_cov_13.505217_5_plen_68_part_00
MGSNVVDGSGKVAQPAPEKKKVTDDMLSPYATDLKAELGIGKDMCEKLVPNLNDKTQYVVDVRNLKF